MKIETKQIVTLFATLIGWLIIYIFITHLAIPMYAVVLIAYGFTVISILGFNRLDNYLTRRR